MEHQAEAIFVFDRKFFFQNASDVQRDGIGCELNEIVGDSDIWIAEVFRSDRKRLIEFNSDARHIPFAAILKLFETFETNIDPEFQ